MSVLLKVLTKLSNYDWSCNCDSVQYFEVKGAKSDMKVGCWTQDWQHCCIGDQSRLTMELLLESG